MRTLLRYTLTAALLLALPAAAQAGEGYQPVQNESKSGTFTRKSEHQRPAWGSKDAPGYAGGGSRGSVNGKSWNSDPVVAQNSAGRYYDKRNGRLLSNDQAGDARSRADNYNQPFRPTIYDASTGKQATGINAGPFKDGRWDWAKGGNDANGNGQVDPGEWNGRVGMDVLRAEGEASARINAGSIDATAKGQVTLIGINGEIEGKYGSEMNNIGGRAEGQAYIGAEAEATVSASVSRNGILANGKVGAFVGGKAQGSVAATATIGGVQTTGKVTGEVSYGLGAEASGYMKFDWTNMSFKIGGRASLTVGVGAGVGGEVEVSFKPAVDWVVKNGGAILDKGASIASAAIDKAKDIGRSLCFWCKDPAPPTGPAPVQAPTAGSNVALNAPTQTVPPVAAATDTPADTNAAQAAGTRNALGRN